MSSPARGKQPVPPAAKTPAKAPAKLPAPPAAPAVVLTTTPLQLLHRQHRLRATTKPETLAAALDDTAAPVDVEELLSALPDDCPRRDDIVNALLERLPLAPLPHDFSVAMLVALRSAFVAACPEQSCKTLAVLRPYRAAFLAASLSGSLLPNVLDACPFPPDNSGTASKLQPSWQEAVLLCCPGGEESPQSRALREPRGPNPDPFVVLSCRLLIAELLAPSLASALDACRPPGATNRTAVSTARSAIHHGWHHTLEDYM